MRYVSDKLMGRKDAPRKKIEREGDGRIIAYAAFGKAAKQINGGLINSDIRPDMYWDIKAKGGDNIGGVPVMQPDFGSLKSNDTILMLLYDNLITSAVTRRIKDAPAHGKIWYYNEVLDYLTGYYYE